ncbi:MAG: hypothetical protein FWH26_00365 [Oscillospiraceae bacterium]|nr:hypothetical protein [Oscillospiraceae bacterium]
MKKIRASLLALCVALGLLAIMPIMAGAATIEVGTQAELSSALSTAASDDTIKLTADINYGTHMNITSKNISFDLNGFTLNANAGLRVDNCKLLLADPRNGAFNVSSTGLSFIVEVFGVNARVEITSAATATASTAVYGNAGEIIVYGDVTQNNGSSAACGGVWVMHGRVTVEGEITVAGDAAYTKFGPNPGTNIAREEYTTPSTKEGYFTYTHGTYGSIWVKDPDYVQPPEPSRGIFGTQPQYNKWYHYILFFLAFGFIWMWF